MRVGVALRAPHLKSKTQPCSSIYTKRSGYTTFSEVGASKGGGCCEQTPFNRGKRTSPLLRTTAPGRIVNRRAKRFLAWFAGGAYGKIRSNGGARWRGHAPCWNGVTRSLSQVQNVIAAKDRGGERLQRDRVSTSALSPLLRGEPCLACTSLIFQ